MTVTVQPITPEFAAEIGDLDLSRPVSEQDLDAVKRAFWRYAVLIFPDQDLSPAMHNAAFAAMGMDNAYVPFHIKPENLGAAVNGYPATFTVNGKQYVAVSTGGSGLAFGLARFSHGPSSSLL